MGNTWTISSPTENQSYKRNATISGGGMTSAPNETSFTAEINIDDVTENSATGNAQMSTWATSISPPQGDNWTVSSNAELKLIPNDSSDPQSVAIVITL